MYNFSVTRLLPVSIACFGLLIACQPALSPPQASSEPQSTGGGSNGHRLSPEGLSRVEEPEPDAKSKGAVLLESGDEEEEETLPGVFPPPDPGPMFERSAQEGDGQWRDFFWFPEGADKKRLEARVESQFASRSVKRLVIHPHEASRFQSLTVAAFDLGQLRLGHVPGRQDIEDVGHGELAPQAGLAPEPASLLAVFNGGFQPKHGRWGMLSLDTQLVAPRSDACTVGVSAEGRAVIAPWLEIEDREGLVAYRQTPPCLVHAGAVHADLLNSKRAAWAGQHADRKTRRRSAVGISEDGRTLFFAVGTETEPEVLAAGMKHVGAQAAAQLDINWNWTRLFLFMTTETEPGRTTTIPVGALLPQMAKDRGEYITRPGKRGFFTLNYRDEAELSEGEAH